MARDLKPSAARTWGQKEKQLHALLEFKVEILRPSSEIIFEGIEFHILAFARSRVAIPSLFLTHGLSPEVSLGLKSQPN